MFNTTDLNKLFDPQQVTKQMQQFFDFNSAASASKQSADSFKKLSTIWAETYSTCCEKQLKACQSAMEESVDCMRDLSTSKGIEDYMAKQAEWSKKWTEKAQATSQDIAETMQKSQAQCSDIIGSLVTSNTNQFTQAAAQFTNTTTNAATNTVNAATSSKSTTR